MATQFDQCYEVPCPKCGAGVIEPCMTEQDKAASHPHASRLRLARATYPDSVAHKYATDDESLMRDAREGRIKAVLWGIHFARNVMKISQDQLDRNLAEMVVDNGIDAS